MSRTARLLALFTTVLAVLGLSATAALAQVPPPDSTGAGQPVATTTIVTHTVPGSGLAPWVVLMVAVLAIAVGAGLTELVHAARRSARSQSLAPA